MKICTWNVNGIKSSILSGFDNFLKEYDPDICCLQEIKTNSDSIRLLQYKFKDYYSYWHVGKKSGYSGVAIIVKKDYQPANVTLGIEDELQDDEARVIIAHYNDY